MLARRLLVVEVAHHHVVAAHDDLAERLAVGGHVLHVLVDDAHALGHDGADALTRAQLRLLVVGEVVRNTALYQRHRAPRPLVVADRPVLERAAEQEIERAGSDSDIGTDTAVAVLQSAIRSQGLPEVIQMVAEAAKPYRIDEYAEVERFEADGTILRYLYRVQWDTAALPPELAEALRADNCGNPAIRVLLDAEATVEHVFRRADTLATIGTVEVTGAHCAGPGSP